MNSMQTTDSNIDIQKNNRQNNSISDIVNGMREYFDGGNTLEYDFRKHQLQKLKQLILYHEDEISSAFYSDLHRSRTEALVAESWISISEIDYAIRKLKKWMKPKKVKTPLFLFYAKTRVTSVPKGVVSIIAPWNYPFLLILSPLVGAMAAGNCVLIKPSESAPATSKLIANMINSNFDKNYIHVVEGGPETAIELLENRFDHIFFTGGTEIGRKVYQAAAKFLTPVTLELGGKSPTIVDKNFNLKVAAKRIVYGKFLNAGQTCVAPDYILVDKKIKQDLIDEIKNTIINIYTEKSKDMTDYARIINDRHYNRLTSLLEEGKIVFGGEIDPNEKYIGPTLIDGVTKESKIMQEEIFGPILPFIEYNDVDEAIDLIKSKEKPLALYIYSKDKNFQNNVLNKTQFGGAMINDSVLQFASKTFPIGGIGNSGMGNYHGKRSFDTFSQERGVINHATWFDAWFRYPPFTKFKTKLLKFFVRTRL